MRIETRVWARECSKFGRADQQTCSVQTRTCNRSIEDDTNRVDRARRAVLSERYFQHEKQCEADDVHERAARGSGCRHGCDRVRRDDE